MHESFDRKEEITGSSDRSFGVVMAVFFAIVAGLPLLRDPPESVRWWALAVAAAFAVMAMWWTAPLAPLNRLWLKLGLVLFRVVSPVVLW